MSLFSSEGKIAMGLFDFLKSGKTPKSEAMTLYKSGMAKAEKRDTSGAIADYTAAIGVIGVPADIKAMAVYNRGVAYVAAGDKEKGMEDLGQVIRMDGASNKVKEMAGQKIKRMERRATRGTEES
ncbi:MAG: hypothetical protein HKN47_00910 [Pirellulaceae bacterium]|nr:hypothetical protein [Pirellulaceae bacterium]